MVTDIDKMRKKGKVPGALVTKTMLSTKYDSTLFNKDLI